MRVDQLVPSVAPGDATTAHTLQVQRLVRDMGMDSEIYALAVHPRLEERVRLVGEMGGRSRPQQFLLYQYAAVSELADWAAARGVPLALNYHNVTPPELFRPWDPDIALSMHAAQVQLRQLAPRTSVGICVSRFNEDDLRSRGYRATVVAPILLDLEEFDAAPDPATVGALEGRRADGAPHWLFVGGVAPHKAQHRLVQALATYRAVYHPRARLSLVGKVVAPGYHGALRALVRRLGLEDAVDLPGAVTHEQLGAYDRAADVFVCLSAHEGFCVPLLEAMHHRLPVVAFRAGAVPETLGLAGILLDDRAPHLVAAAVHRLAADETLRAVLSDVGKARLAHFSLERARGVMAGVLRRWVASGGAWAGPDDLEAQPA
jgi:glycosyltransferase involved in cell wall biosynthesis